jgi:pimeloyl-ACP methyl ester carboxylesterase
MKQILFFSIITVLFSCMKLDDIAFYNEPLPEYQLDGYDVELNFRLDSSYDVDNVHQFSVQSDEFNIAALYIGDLGQIVEDTIILYCHGQSLHMDHYWQRAKLLANCGSNQRFGILMFDYRGYGLSEGNPTEEGMYKDVRAAYQWLLDNGSNSNKIIVYGFSLGSAPATDLAAFGYNGEFPSKLILESPFASTNFIAQESTLIEVSASYITSLEFDNTNKIKRVYNPFMWLHGTDDDYVAISNGEAIIANYPGSDSTYIRVEGAFHGANGVPQTMGYEEYLNSIEKFITQ